tara:strand:+ start:728 stop:943 length:216 start_codon:yes stop_codon:yes gene_type:complete
MSAKEETLGELHEALANELLRKIKTGEATASELSVAVKFLKDNGIEAEFIQDSPIANLLSSLPKFEDERHN